MFIDSFRDSSKKFSDFEKGKFFKIDFSNKYESIFF